MPPLLTPGQPVERPNWFASSVAQRLINAEQRDVIPLLTAHIGVRGLYLRPAASVAPALSGNMLQSVVSLHRQPDDDVLGGLGGELRCSEQALPFENDSLCLGYLLHAFEGSDDPESLVAELQRILRPEGVLFVIGLSPQSPWRLRWARHGLHARSAARLRGLLSAAGLAVELQLGLGPVSPIAGDGGGVLPASERGAGALLDPLRPGYLLIARKRRASLTPIGPRQRAAVGFRTQVGAG